MSHGILIIDKPSGMTSHDVVNRIRRIFKTKRVGHTGTLDPEATGVLVLCLGNGTRLAEYLSAAQKQYTAEFKFGIETDTQDIWGTVVAESDATSLTEADLIGALERFRGTIYQIPPMVSARHHEGKRLYELARKGVTVEREPRPVEIFNLTMTRFTAGVRATAEIEVDCSTGTYIRTLAHDIGNALGVGAAMSALRRTSVGSAGAEFTLEHTYTLEVLTDYASIGEGKLAATVLPLTFAVRDWPHAQIDSVQEERIRNGQLLTLDEASIAVNAVGNGPIALLDLTGDLIAVAKINEDRMIQPVKVMKRDQALGAGV